MKKWFLRIILSVLAAALSLFILLAILLSNLDPNAFKDDIADFLKKKLGKELIFDGNLRVVYFPHPSLSIGKIRLLNESPFEREPFAGIKESSAQLSLKDLLLYRTLRLRSLSLDGLQIHLVRSATGKKNWAKDQEEASPREGPVPLAPQKTKQTSGRKPEKKKKRVAFAIERFSFANSTLTYTDLVSEQEFTIHIDDFSADKLTEQGKAALRLSGSVQEKSDKRSIEFTAVLQEAFFNRQHLQAQLSELAMLFSPSPLGNGNKRIVSLQATADLSMRFDEHSLAAANINGSLDGHNFQGTIQCFLPGHDALSPEEQFAGNGSLAFGQLKAKDLAAIWTSFQKAPPATPPAVSIQTAPDDTHSGLRAISGLPAWPKETRKTALANRRPFFTFLKKLRCNLSVTCASVHTENAHVHDLSLEIHAGQGTCHLPFAFSLNEGKITGEATADLRPEKPYWQLTLTVEKLNPASVFNALDAKELLSGNIEGSVDLEATGENRQDIERSLSGTVQGTLVQGRLRVPQNISQDKLFAALHVPLAIPVDKAAFQLHLQDGTAQIQSFSAQSPFIRLEGWGSVNYLDRTLDLRCKGMKSQGEAALQFRVQGPWKQPGLYFDKIDNFEKLLEKGLKSKRLKRFLQIR